MGSTRASRLGCAVLGVSVIGNVVQYGYAIRERRRSEADAQTGLPGRRAWDRRSAELMRELHASSESGGILMIDINDLKQINDRFGHSAGDEAVALVGTAIAQSIRRDDMAARIGGDEFVVMIASGTRSDCAMVDARIRARVAELASQAGGPKVAVSIGIATYPEDGIEINELLGVADRQLYRDKRADPGRGAVAAR